MSESETEQPKAAEEKPKPVQFEPKEGVNSVEIAVGDKPVRVEKKLDVPAEDTTTIAALDAHPDVKRAK